MDGMSWDIKIPNMLLGLRATPCTATNKSPAELLFNRRVRTLLDTINLHDKQQKTRENQVERKSNKKNRQTDIGQKVMYRNFSRGPHWLASTVVNKEGPSSYCVKTRDGTIVNRHIDQLIKQHTQHTATEQENEEQGRDRETEMVEHNNGEGQDQAMEEIPSSQDSDQIIEIR
ncbi:hypothetical protein PYW08_002349 [Mythimna loreyi]|uniref:Uncharacterized protein n=1 Tax=Mythimna loreyi TaxID=667449 RepID=A0ACC2R1G9_9NEOP|nr:hypothetical protein PYW08_002349 [Mythimna loreyi]